MKNIITFLEIAAFLASLAAWRVILTSRYMRLFPLLLFIVVAPESYETFFRPASQESNAVIYNVQVPLQDLLYLLILYYATVNRKHRFFLMVSFIMFAIFCIGTTLYFTPPNHFNILSYCIGSIIVIIGILLKFYEMLKSPAEFNFLKKPFFYMLFAFLLFNVSTLPYFTMINWLAYFKPGKSLFQILSNAMSIMNYILYSTYVIGFIWMIRKKAYS